MPVSYVLLTQTWRNVTHWHFRFRLCLENQLK